MPTPNLFHGIVNQMFRQDHPPPNVHALYAEHEALVDIRKLDVMDGNLPRRALARVRQRARAHRAEMMEDRAVTIRTTRGPIRG
jgi:hypothetical protein